jgi:hypothetical protein
VPDWCPSAPAAAGAECHPPVCPGLEYKGVDFGLKSAVALPFPGKNYIFPPPASVYSVNTGSDFPVAPFP